MVTINFTQLRQNAKVYFDAVEKGETVYVKRHGKVIAKITTSSPKQPVWKKEALRLKIPGVSLSQSILKEREESA